METKIKELLIKYGKNQSDLARHLETNPVYLSRWMNGKVKFPINMIKPIADYFGVTTDYLLSDDNDSMPDTTVHDQVEEPQKSHLKEAS